jgi:hypothetical protein
MHNYEDNAKFHSAFLAAMLNYATRFRRKWGVIENVEYLGKFEEYISDWKMQKKFKNRL